MVTRPVVMRTILPGVLAASALGSCKPDLDDVVSTITTPRVLAVQSQLLVAPPAGAAAAGAPSEEAEVRPTETMQLTALSVDPSGRTTGAAIDWAFCNARKPLAELGPVNRDCYASSGDWFTELGMGGTVSAAVPRTACQLFGSDAPQPKLGEPPGRPVDPDPTGGYYQPARLLAPGTAPETVTIAETRILCTLASFSPEVVAAYQQRYHRNTNPAIAALGVAGAPAPWAEAPTPNEVAVGEVVTLEVSWSACPTVDVPDDGVCGPDETGTACGTCGPDVAETRHDCCVDTNCVHALGCRGAERYVALDPATGALVDRREAIGVAWFTTGGSFAVARTGRSDDDVASTSDNTWRAPDVPGPVTIWVVLRDDRGGVGWREYAVEVR
jgi:hypothetical protein